MHSVTIPFVPHAGFAFFIQGHYSEEMNAQLQTVMTEHEYKLSIGRINESLQLKRWQHNLFILVISLWFLSTATHVLGTILLWALEIPPGPYVFSFVMYSATASIFFAMWSAWLYFALSTFLRYAFRAAIREECERYNSGYRTSPCRWIIHKSDTMRELQIESVNRNEQLNAPTQYVTLHEPLLQTSIAYIAV